MACLRAGLSVARMARVGRVHTLRDALGMPARMSVSTQASAAAAADWAKTDERRLLHAVFTVHDLQQSIDWYTKNLGMQVLWRRDVPEGKYSSALVGYGPQDKGFFALELTQRHDLPSGSEADIDLLGEGFGHFGLAVADVYKTVERIKANGGKVTRDAGPVKGGTTVIAFVEDPTGYKWELIERPRASIRDPICQVMLRVANLQESVKYYTEVLGLKLLRTRDNPDYKYTLAFLGYGEEVDVPVFELTYNYGKDTPYAKGNPPGYAYVAISTQDVSKTAEQVKAAAAGGSVTASSEPGSLPLPQGSATEAIDPDGWKLVFVDSKDFEKELHVQ